MEAQGLNNQNELHPKMRDITHYIKEYMFKPYNDEEFQLVQKKKQEQQDYAYEDIFFPPNDESLGKSIIKKKCFAGITWKRVSEILNQGQLVVIDPSQNQRVLQGQIGDCYLINPIAILAQRQKNYALRLFSIRAGNSFGYYSVWLFIDGQWRYIVVDDWFPFCTKTGLLYFCKNIGNQIWPMLIEKAWAKLHGNFSQLWGGDTNTALRVITGAPVQRYTIMKKFKKDPRTKDRFFEMIKQHFQKGYLISMITGELDENGKAIMTQGHSYALYDIKEDEKKFVIRDPRGIYNPFKTEFVEVSWSQSLYLFTNMVICKLNMDYVFTQFALECKQLDKTEDLVKLKVDKKSQMYFSIYQPNKRFLQNNQDKKAYKYAKITVKVLKIDKKDKTIINIKRVAQKIGTFVYGDLELNLKGTYYIYIMCEWKCAVSRKINLVSYGEKYVTFEKVENDQKLVKIKEFLATKKQENFNDKAKKRAQSQIELKLQFQEQQQNQQLVQQLYQKNLGKFSQRQCQQQLHVIKQQVLKLPQIKQNNKKSLINNFITSVHSITEVPLLIPQTNIAVATNRRSASKRKPNFSLIKL